MEKLCKPTGTSVGPGGPLPAEADALAPAVRSELKRVLASRVFGPAEAQKRFLQYIVEESLGGKSGGLKEYTIGVHVFNRGENFDPRLDSIVRVEARNLRARLAKYYESEGCEQGLVKIELPARGYVPSFRCVSNRKTGPQDTPSANASTTKEARVEAPAPPTVPDADSVSAHYSKAFKGPPTGSPRLLIRVGAIAALLVLACLGIYAGRIFLENRGSARSAASIAVLPLQNLGDTGDESFTDGLTDELIDSLGRVQGLQVVARTSAFQFRSKTVDAREIGKRLNVRTLLEGSVRIYGNRLRVTAALEDTTNGFRIWSNSYERNFENALFVQRDISEAIVEALRGQFSMIAAPQELKFSPAKANPVNIEAYQDYLKGLYFWNKQTKESIETAKSHFEKSIQLDPTYAPSYTGLARCYVNLPGFTSIPPQEVTSKIRGLAERALQLDSGLAEAHIQLAYALFLEYRWSQADAEFKRGLDLAPGDALGHVFYANYLSELGRLPEALAESQVAQQLDPVSPYMFCGVGVALHQMRRYDESIQVLKRALELEPQNGHAHLWIGRAYIEKHQYLEAIAELKRAQQSMGDYPPLLGDFARAYALSGERPEAQQILNGLLQPASANGIPANTIAAVYAALGDEDKAMTWLAKSVTARDVRTHLISDPAYDRLRTNTRFDELLAEAGLPRTPLFVDAKSQAR